MIVLDEQLRREELRRALGQWYRGPVVPIVDLHPGTTIKDDRIPSLLRQQNQPTFITINEKDFWQRVAIDDRFGVICFALRDSQLGELSGLLRSVLRLPEFRTKARRMGLVLRVTHETVSYYTHRDRQVRVAR